LASQVLHAARVLNREVEFGLRSLLGAARSTTGSTRPRCSRCSMPALISAKHHLALVPAAATAVLEYQAALFGEHPAAARTVLHWLSDRAGSAGRSS
jgi:hypothetical protein